MKEQLLEPLLRKMRIRRVLPALKQYPACRLLDVGCGWEARFLREVEPYIGSGIGIDRKAPAINNGKIHTRQAAITDTLPFPDASFDVVTMLAVLEHLEDAQKITGEIFRVLHPGGSFVGTVPGKRAKPVLEFLSYRLGIVNPEEIRDHKRYYDRNSLYALLSGQGFRQIRHVSFQWGLNNFFSAVKRQSQA
jgi:ubiquinone/menaquinone biosynthesis C-methylase UbiE